MISYGTILLTKRIKMRTSQEEIRKTIYNIMMPRRNRRNRRNKRAEPRNKRKRNRIKGM